MKELTFLCCVAVLSSCSLPKKVDTFDDKIKGKAFIQERHNRYILVSKKDGNRHGRIAYYNLEGNLVVKGRYTKGKPIGFWRSYSSNSDLHGLYLYLPNDTIVIRNTIINVAW